MKYGLLKKHGMDGTGAIIYHWDLIPPKMVKTAATKEVEDWIELERVPKALEDDEDTVILLCRWNPSKGLETAKPIILPFDGPPAVGLAI